MFLKNEICMISVPKFVESSIKSTWKIVKEDEEVLMYFPNYPGEKLPSWIYFWNVIYFKQYTFKIFFYHLILSILKNSLNVVFNLRLKKKEMLILYQFLQKKFR